MNLVILGMPGAGKGTVATALAKEFGWQHISTGELLRAEIAAQSPIGQRVNHILASGGLVADEIMATVVEQAIQAFKKDFILDGYPRTLKQCQLLADVVLLDKVFYLAIDEVTALQRLLGRSQSMSTQREDDNEEIIRKRLIVFKQNNQPILNYYKQNKLLSHIDGAKSIEVVCTAVKNQLGVIGAA